MLDGGRMSKFALLGAGLNLANYSLMRECAIKYGQYNTFSQKTSFFWLDVVNIMVYTLYILALEICCAETEKRQVLRKILIILLFISIIS
jgi:hypothetical protein